MYRRYEDPHMLQEKLERVRQELALEEDEDRRIDLVLEVNELEERINFAWQDDEYEEDYVRENYPELYMSGEWREYDE